MDFLHVRRHRCPHLANVLMGATCQHHRVTACPITVQSMAVAAVAAEVELEGLHVIAQLRVSQKGKCKADDRHWVRLSLPIEVFRGGELDVCEEEFLCESAEGWREIAGPKGFPRKIFYDYLFEFDGQVLDR